MAMLGTRKKGEGKSRIHELEKLLDLKNLEKTLEKLDLKDIEKKLERLDLKDIEKRLDFDKELASRYREIVGRRQREQKKSGSGKFILGLVLGAVVGVVLATVLGKKQNGDSVMDQVTNQADALRDTAADQYQNLRGEGTEQTSAAAEPFGGEAAIEREVNNGDDFVDSARDTVDSASEDVQSSVEDVQSESDASSDKPEGRTGSI